MGQGASRLKTGKEAVGEAGQQQFVLNRVVQSTLLYTAWTQTKKFLSLTIPLLLTTNHKPCGKLYLTVLQLTVVCTRKLQSILLSGTLVPKREKSK